MPKIPKTEDPESSKKGPTEKSSKGSKASAAQKGSVEKTGKPKGKAAKDAGKADKAAPVKRERKVYELPGQTKDTPPEVCFLHVVECCLDQTGSPDRFLRPTAASLWVTAHGVHTLNADTKPITQQMGQDRCGHEDNACRWTLSGNSTCLLESSGQTAPLLPSGEQLLHQHAPSHHTETLRQSASAWPCTWRAQLANVSCCCGLIGRHGCCRLLQVGLLPLEEAKVEAAKLKNLR